METARGVEHLLEAGAHRLLLNQYPGPDSLIPPANGAPTATSTPPSAPKNTPTSLAGVSIQVLETTSPSGRRSRSRRGTIRNSDSISVLQSSRVFILSPWRRQALYLQQVVVTFSRFTHLVTCFCARKQLQTTRGRCNPRHDTSDTREEPREPVSGSSLAQIANNSTNLRLFDT